MKNLFACVCIALVLFSCKNGTNDSPKKTVAAFIEASKEGNITNLKKYLTRSDVSLLEMGETFLAKFDTARATEMKDKMSKQFKEKTKDANIEIKDEKIDGNNATVNVQFDHNGKSETHPFTLTKEDGQWKVSLLSTGLQNSGSDKKDMQEALKHMNMDNLQGSINEGMKELNKMDKDSLKKVIDEGMKEVEKLKNSPEN